MCDNDDVIPFAARDVAVTFNNNTQYNLQLKRTNIPHGIFNPYPPSFISAKSTARWGSESSGFLTGTEALAYYGVSGTNVEFELYWNNPAIGSNSYGANVNNNNGNFSVTSAGTSGNHSSVTFAAFQKSDWNYSSWMKTIDGNRLISRLSVPGTHQSCATYSPDGDILGIIICQDKSLTEQLLTGIRFLDIRCKAIDGIFAIHHGLVYQNLNFGDVMNACINFLNLNPSETILMRIKQEESTISDAEFIRIFNERYGNYHYRMYLNSTVPSLAQVRGKVVILANVSGLPGISWSSLKVQDNYNPSGFDVKVSYIKNHLNTTITDHVNGGNGFFVNFISKQGIPTVLTIREAAQRLNPIFLSMMIERTIPSGTGVGIIPMDFPNHSDGVVRGIIDNNF